MRSLPDHYQFTAPHAGGRALLPRVSGSRGGATSSPYRRHGGLAILPETPVRKTATARQRTAVRGTRNESPAAMSLSLSTSADPRTVRLSVQTSLQVDGHGSNENCQRMADTDGPAWTRSPRRPTGRATTWRRYHEPRRDQALSPVAPRAEAGGRPVCAASPRGPGAEEGRPLTPDGPSTLAPPVGRGTGHQGHEEEDRRDGTVFEGV